jgi:hypothetical protein
MDTKYFIQSFLRGNQSYNPQYAGKGVKRAGQRAVASQYELYGYQNGYGFPNAEVQALARERKYRFYLRLIQIQLSRERKARP